jgi:hypothetical protein
LRATSHHTCVICLRVNLREQCVGHLAVSGDVFGYDIWEAPKTKSLLCASRRSLRLCGRFMWKSVHRRDAELAEVRGAEIRTLPFQLTFLTLVVSLGYLDVVTQNFRPLAFPRAHLALMKSSWTMTGDELESLLNRFAAVQNMHENQRPIIYTKALTLPGDSVECALALSFPWRSSL